MANAFEDKARLLNTAIEITGDRYHETFRKPSSEETALPSLSSGLIDMAWILPTPKNTLSGITLFLNIYDEENCSSDQLHQLFQISSISIVLMSAKNISDPNFLSLMQEIIQEIYAKDSVPVIIVNDRKKLKSNDEVVTAALSVLNDGLPEDKRVSRKNKNIFIPLNEQKAAEDVIVAINEAKGLIKLKKLSDIKDTLHNHERLWQVDENNKDWQMGKKMAEDILKFVIKNDLAGTKKNNLGLQALWVDWVRLEKKLQREVGKAENANAFVAKIEKDKRVIRDKQQKTYSKMSPLMKEFLKKLLTAEVNVVRYMLKQMQQHLDDYGRSSLPALRKDKIDLQKQGEDLVEIDKLITESSLGLEHFMREMGHMYDAAHHCSSHELTASTLNLTALPTVMANLLLSGYNIELIDGDASHVPIMWISSVLKEVKKIIGDNKKIFTLSILGLQSSGKSTLLNSMFGLQFAVSAGRCTRGVYGQLIPACKTVTPDIDYIFVLDTEGLRAPELGTRENTYQHDHEIATFVIGLANTTIINIQGELSPEMQDVLEIVVHAFLRISQVNPNLRLLSSSCIFVHHNVSATNAREKIAESQQKLLGKLNEMTVATARQENFGEIKKFTDVIYFDPEQHVLYFPHLWQQDPPMAIANPGYSNKVKELKELVFNSAESNFSAISQINFKMKDLWNGIVKENFVFNFRNSIEIRAYTSLESILGELKWKMLMGSSELVDKAKNEIRSSHADTDWASLLQFKLDAIEGEVNNMLIQFNNSMEKFFEESTEKNELEKWRSSSSIKLQEEATVTLSKINSSLINCVDSQKLENRNEKELSSYKNEIFKAAKDLALNLREQGKISDSKLKQKFDLLWTAHVDKLRMPSSADVPPSLISGIILKQMKNALPPGSDPFIDQLTKEKKQTQNMQLSNYDFDAKRDLDLKRQSIFGQSMAVQECSNIVYKMLEKEFHSIDTVLNKLSNTSFQEVNVLKIFRSLVGKVEDINKDYDKYFNLTRRFKVSISLFVCSYITPKLESFQCNFLLQNDPKLKLERTFRSPMLTIFRNVYHQTVGDISVAEAFCQCLKPLIIEAVDHKMPLLLANNIRSVMSCFSSKEKLETTVLKELLLKDDFDAFKEHINSMDSSYYQWTEVMVNMRLFGSSALHTEIEQAIIKDVILTLSKSIEKRRGCQDFEKFIDKVHDDIKETMPIQLSSINFMMNEMTAFRNLNSFANSLESNLRDLEEELIDIASRKTSEDVKRGEGSVYYLLLKECIGCCEKCPFCKSQCSLTQSGHNSFVKHTTQHHMSQGLSCRKWESEDDERDKKLVVEICTADVASAARFRNADTKHEWYPYKDYQKLYPSWYISSDPSLESSLYWKYVFAKYANNFAKAYNAKKPDIPPAWQKITKDEVLRYLETIE